MSNLKKVLALVLVFALSLTMFAGAIETVFPYDDVDELTAEQLDALQLVNALGVFKGDGTSINANDEFSRAELAAVLYRLYTGDAEGKYISTYTTTSPYFSDVDGEWYTPYTNWAYVKGVILGVGGDKFAPDMPVDGVQAATMMARLLGYEVAGENWELTARKIAVEVGLDDGVESKDLFGTALTRGDMIVMVANTLNATAVGSKVTMAEEIYDLEVIEGAILLGSKKLGDNEYSIFNFKVQDDDSLWFANRFLKIEEDPTTDEIGQKYTLYVAKSDDYLGYKVLYAAYEMEQDGYYKVVTGRVDDEKLVMDPAKDDYLEDKLSKFVTVYINGVPGYTFADFADAYGAKNPGTYKLIDNDGDGLYEYIFIEKLTFAALTKTEVVTNVVSYNAGKVEYTLADGNTYAVGGYWDVNSKDEIIGYNNALDEVEDLIGKNSWTASSTQYKFTIVDKYIMKVEVCDETYFAGDYVLSMGVVGESTYKGMRYVEFLTEDNTALYAYVSKIDNLDAKLWANLVDNKSGAYYEDTLFYVNAYGEDTVELYTANYWNTYHEVYDYVDGTYEDSIVAFDTSDFIATAAVDDVFKIVRLEDKDGALVPTEQFDKNAVYVKFTRASGTAGDWYYNSTTKCFSKDDYNNNGSTFDLSGVVLSSKSFMGALEASYADDNYFYARLVAKNIDAKKIDVKVGVEFETSELQIFKAYGTWYIQSYGDADYDAREFYFIADGITTQVRYSTQDQVWYVVEDGVMTDVEYVTGVTNARDLYIALRAVWNDIIADTTYTPGVNDDYNTSNPFVYAAADALNESKGVIFAYGRQQYSLFPEWKAYNLDEFNVSSYGVGGPDDDVTGVDDELIFANSNGTLYVKAAKVTVSDNDLLPAGYMVENSDVFVVGADGVDLYDKAGRNIEVLTVNGGKDYVYVPYGTVLPAYSIVYAVKNDAGEYVSFDVIGHLFGAVLDENTTESAKWAPTLDVDASGVVTVQGKLGLTYTKTLDLTKTFFMVDGVPASCEKFAKALDDKEITSIDIVASNSGYFFVYGV